MPFYFKMYIKLFKTGIKFIFAYYTIQNNGNLKFA
jgi:hypothetical protein